MNCELALIVDLSLHALKTPTNFPRIHPPACTNEMLQDRFTNEQKKPTKMQVRGVKMKRKKEVEMYSLGSPKALTQFLYQRLSLPFFGDVRE